MDYHFASYVRSAGSYLVSYAEYPDLAIFMLSSSISTQKLEWQIGYDHFLNTHNNPYTQTLHSAQQSNY
jgi:hypothetical protein